MKKTIFAILASTLICFQSLAFADDSCVPTMTVEEATAHFNSEMKLALQQLNQDYENALSIHGQANSEALAAYNQRVKEIDAAYTDEAHKIAEDFNLGWREALKAATEKRNKLADQAAADYLNGTVGNQSAYNQTVAEAKNNYNKKMEKITADYNVAVCLGD